LKQGLRLPYCVSHMLLRIHLTMDVCCVLWCVRLAMDYMEGFVLCLQRVEGVSVTDLLLCNQILIC